MKPSSDSCPFRLRRLPEALASLVLLASTGCVTSVTHDAVRDELARTQQSVTRLEERNASLEAERIALLEDLEDTSVELAATERERARLSDELGETKSRVEVQHAEISALRATYDGLVEDLQSEVTEGRVEIERVRDGIRVKLAQSVLFPSGSAELGARGEEVIGKVAARLAGLDHTVEVQGHTDSVPIRGALAVRYPSNWELAGARAGSVVRLLAEHGVPEPRLTAVSYGATRPRADNETPEGRARNRRIEIRLKPVEAAEAAALAEPAEPARTAVAADAPAAAP